ncbi:MAG: hypothetical protein HC806_00965 [Anaerolineae bacterium]|nr:hypothetical protein [Anaerolineae bacterium]
METLLEKLLNALNAFLPKAMAVQHIETTRDDFHPRFEAISRCYRYTVFTHPVRHPNRERFAWRMWKEMDFSLLEKASSAFLGTHDLQGFGTPPRPGGITIRNVFVSKWHQPSASEYVYDIEANAFLYHMVRRIVQFQVEVATGKRSAESIQMYLKEKQPGSFLGLAPPQGLNLLSVQYPEE